MILNEFFNLPQVFEKNMTEGVMSEIDAELRDIVAREDFDALYELFSANTPAGRYVQDMYDDVVIDAGLHPDDDFERIEQIVFDRLADDFGEQDVTEKRGDLRPKLGSARDRGKSVRQWRQNRGLDEQGVAEGIFGKKKSEEPFEFYLDGCDPHAVKKYLLNKFGSQGWRVAGPGVGASRVFVAMSPELYPTGNEAKWDIEANCGEQGVVEGLPEAYGPYGKKSPQDIEKIKKYKEREAKNTVPGQLIKPESNTKKAQYSRDQALSYFARTNEQGVAEAKDDYVPPKEADYGKKYQDMVKRVGEKARAQEKAKQQPKAPVRESRLALLKQIIQS